MPRGNLLTDEQVAAIGRTMNAVAGLTAADIAGGLIPPTGARNGAPVPPGDGQNWQVVTVTGDANGAGFYPGRWYIMNNQTYAWEAQGIILVRAAREEMELVPGRYYRAFQIDYVSGLAVFVVLDAPCCDPTPDESGSGEGSGSGDGAGGSGGGGDSESPMTTIREYLTPCAGPAVDGWIERPVERQIFRNGLLVAVEPGDSCWEWTCCTEDPPIASSGGGDPNDDPTPCEGAPEPPAELCATVTIDSEEYGLQTYSMTATYSGMTTTAYSFAVPGGNPTDSAYNGSVLGVYLQCHDLGEAGLFWCVRLEWCGSVAMINWTPVALGGDFSGFISTSIADFDGVFCGHLTNLFASVSWGPCP